MKQAAKNCYSLFCFSSLFFNTVHQGQRLMHQPLRIMGKHFPIFFPTAHWYWYPVNIKTYQDLFHALSSFKVIFTSALVAVENRKE